MIDALLVVLVVVLAVGALYLWKRNQSMASAIERATQRIGSNPQHKGEAALTAGIERIERYLARAERERAQLVGSLEAAQFGVAATDDSGTITFVNPAATDFVGALHGDVIEDGRIKELIDSVVLARAPSELEFETFTPVRRVLRLYAAPLEYGVESVGAVVYIEDVTDQRRTNAIRRDFIANVGHELKTPLGALSVLAETIADSDDATVRTRLGGRLSQESRRISNLIDDILDLAQVESFAAAPEPIAISEVISDAASQVQLAAEAAGVVLFTEPVPADAFVAGDRRQVVTAVTNLLDNAVKYTAVKEADAGKVRVRVTVEEPWVSIEVRDEGIGIPESHLDRIFERFYRVDKARSRETGGTGLGLAIVRHVAINHGGEVSVSSEEGSGSTFTLRLPPFSG
ncbi:MAG: ATP-binding protein [Acidimicrobiia bacterium]|nr:ATP-binding protein [Acidimicrobiia bacterium]